MRANKPAGTFEFKLTFTRTDELHQTVMFSAIVRRAVQPSLRQARSYTHTRSMASESSSKLEKGEQILYDKLSERFQPSELLVQDVSGAPLSSHTVLVD